MKRLTHSSTVPLLLALLILLPVYLNTLQTIPNGAEHYYTIDVGETQIVLNTWGTLHATGYPLYVMVGNILVAVLRVFGVSAAAAPGMTSLMYGLIALSLIYVLAAHITNRRWLAAVFVILFGLTRTVWVHQAIAEIYSFGLLLLALLLLIALWQRPIRGRLYWLAFIGGFGVFHHRALLMVAPALFYAVWRELFPSRLSDSDTKPLTLGTRYSALSTILVCLLLGLLGFLPYIYLPLRAAAGARWVYGEPGSWDGFWDQFLGREASRFIGAPATVDGLRANFTLINTVLITDLTVPGIVLGLLGLLLALRKPARRHTAITLLLSGGAAYIFHVLLYTDVLSALILPVTLSLVFGWLLLAEQIIQFEPQSRRERSETKAVINTTFQSRSRGFIQLAEELLFRSQALSGMFIGTACIISAVFLITQNGPFIQDLTSNHTGIDTIELAQRAPDNSVLMLDWGPRHFAVGFARDVLGELPNITLVDHKADFQSLVNRDGRKLVTADFTFYNRTINWWEERLGGHVYVRAAAPHLVEIALQPRLSAEGGSGLQQYNAQVDCTNTILELDVDWFTADVPAYDLSVFVHLLDSSGSVIAQADQIAPVYGWRPLTSWLAGEVVRDIYPLPRLPSGDRIRYGLYRQLASGEFVNEYEYEIPVKCE